MTNGDCMKEASETVKLLMFLDVFVGTQVFSAFSLFSKEHFTNKLPRNNLLVIIFDSHTAYMRCNVFFYRREHATSVVEAPFKPL